jgi:hypothetical protein
MSIPPSTLGGPLGSVFVDRSVDWTSSRGDISPTHRSPKQERSINTQSSIRATRAALGMQEPVYETELSLISPHVGTPRTRVSPAARGRTTPRHGLPEAVASVPTPTTGQPRVQPGSSVARGSTEHESRLRFLSKSDETCIEGVRYRHSDRHGHRRPASTHVDGRQSTASLQHQQGPMIGSPNETIGEQLPPPRRKSKNPNRRSAPAFPDDLVIVPGVWPPAALQSLPVRGMPGDSSIGKIHPDQRRGEEFGGSQSALTATAIAEETSVEVAAEVPIPDRQEPTRVQPVQRRTSIECDREEASLAFEREWQAVEELRGAKHEAVKRMEQRGSGMGTQPQRLQPSTTGHPNATAKPRAVPVVSTPKIVDTPQCAALHDSGRQLPPNGQRPVLPRKPQAKGIRVQATLRRVPPGSKIPGITGRPDLEEELATDSSIEHVAECRVVPPPPPHAAARLQLGTPPQTDGCSISPTTDGGYVEVGNDENGSSNAGRKRSKRPQTNAVLDGSDFKTRAMLPLSSARNRMVVGMAPPSNASKLVQSRRSGEENARTTRI